MGRPAPRGAEMSQNDNVVVIHYNDDGDRPSLEQMPWSTLRARLKEHYYGERVKFASATEKFDAEYFVGLVVILGRVVQPAPVQLVTDYDLPEVRGY